MSVRYIVPVALAFAAIAAYQLWESDKSHIAFMQQTAAVSKRVVVMGGTGGVGSQVVRLLIKDPRVSQVTAIVRSAKGVKFWVDDPNANLAKFKEYVVADFDKLDQHEDAFKGHDALISCVGMYTSRVKSEEEFLKVEHDYAKVAATFSRKHGATSFGYLSGQGVQKPKNVGVFTPMFGRVKGRAEEMFETTFPYGISARPGGIFNRPGGDGAAVGGIWGKIIDTGAFNWMAKTDSLGIDSMDLAKSIVQGAVIAPAASASVENDGLKKIARKYDEDLAKALAETKK